jgi:hypothetical protein
VRPSLAGGMLDKRGISSLKVESETIVPSNANRTSCQSISLSRKWCRRIGISLLLASPLSRLDRIRFLPFNSLPCAFFSANTFDMDIISDAAHRVATVGPRTAVMLVVAATFLIISWISFTLRVYVRTIVIRSWGWDDWTMLLTICLSTTCCSLLICIERIEQSERPQRVLDEGIQAQIELLNYLMTVCCTCYTLLHQY